jgi:hypothetical protein
MLGIDNLTGIAELFRRRGVTDYQNNRKRSLSLPADEKV